MIRCPEVRVINEEGKQLGIYPSKQAVTLAGGMGLDLVEINPKGQPPVCKIMDFGKFKYEQKKQANIAKKNQKIIEVKEIKLRPKTGAHDLEFKTKHIVKFLEEGNKVKVTVRFRGREMAHPNIAREMLEQIILSVSNVSVVEQRQKMEGRSMTIILAPVR